MNRNQTIELSTVRQRRLATQLNGREENAYRSLSRRLYVVTSMIIFLSVCQCVCVLVCVLHWLADEWCRADQSTCNVEPFCRMFGLLLVVPPSVHLSFSSGAIDYYCGAARVPTATRQRCIVYAYFQRHWLYDKYQTKRRQSKSLHSFNMATCLHSSINQ